MTYDDLLILFLGIVGLSCVFQAAVVFVIATRLQGQIDAAANLLERLQRGLETVISGAAAALNATQPVVRAAQELNSQSARFWKHCVTRLENAGRQVGSSVQSGRTALRELDEDFDHLTHRYETAAGRVQKAILRPCSKMVAMTQGIRQALLSFIRKG